MTRKLFRHRVFHVGLMLFAAASGLAGTATSTAFADDNVQAGVNPSQTVRSEKVLIIGASVAAGWRDDKTSGGYLQRALHAYENLCDAQFQVYNKAIPGQRVENIAGKYVSWLDTIHPDAVVIAWGGLNDLHQKTPMTAFRSQIRWEIETALEHQAVVFVVTPPVSKASFTVYRVAQPALLQNEMDVATGFHSPNVYVFDVFDQMKQYLDQHDQTYVPYMADGWHPNAQGHALAAALLTEDWIQQFANKWPLFVNISADRRTMLHHLPQTLKELR